MSELQDEIGRLQREVLRLTGELEVERARSSEAREEEARQKRVDATARAAYTAMDCDAERAYRFAEYVAQRQAILKAADHLAQRAQSATSSASSVAQRAKSATSKEPVAEKLRKS
jgi:hypothetical protein